jgi:hypothetical protein
MLVIETPWASLVAGTKWFPGTSTSRFNGRHKLFGQIFSGRYQLQGRNSLGAGQWQNTLRS